MADRPVFIFPHGCFAAGMAEFYFLVLCYEIAWSKQEFLSIPGTYFGQSRAGFLSVARRANVQSSKSLWPFSTRKGRHKDVRQW